MKIVCLIVLCFLSAGVFGQDSRVMDLTYDKAWSAVAQALVLQGLSISSQDKNAGFIKVSGSFEGDANFSCPRAGGALDSRTYELNVFLAPDGERTAVSINALAKERRYRNKKLIFITIGRVWDEYECTSTGKIEDAIFNALGTNLSRLQ